MINIATNKNKEKNVPFVSSIETLNREKSKFQNFYKSYKVIPTVNTLLKFNKIYTESDTNIKNNNYNNINNNHNNDDNNDNNDNNNITNKLIFNNIHADNNQSNILFGIKKTIKKGLLNEFIEFESKVMSENDIKINKLDIDKIYKKGIKIINNVYQEKYKNSINVTGFGDFIRGCYFLLDFCEKFNFELKIHLFHPISKFFNNYYQYPQTFTRVFQNIKFFTDNNLLEHAVDISNNIINIKNNKYNSFVDYLTYDIPVYKNSVFIYSISYPINDISEKHKIYMRNFLDPNIEIKRYVSNTLSELKMNIKKYITIHIRNGDQYLKTENTTIINDKLNKFKVCIQDIIYSKINEYNINNKDNNDNIDSNMNNPIDFLLISDNVNLKHIIVKIFPFIKTIFKPITHFGEGIKQEDEKMKNTLLDFYLLSFSREIYALSTYNHGSGFSQWCAETYNIPYSCKYIK
jgi:hypothetical protein